MPVATLPTPVGLLAPPSRPDELVNYWVDNLDSVKEALGLNYVAGYEQRLIPANSYPVVAVNPGRSEKTIHANKTWLYTWRISFYVMHAKATVSHLQRSREEAQLVTNLVEYIERDKTLGRMVIFSWITDEVPGVLRPYAENSDMVLSTRLDWFATSEGRFQ